jgi:hypothetical protein
MFPKVRSTGLFDINCAASHRYLPRTVEQLKEAPWVRDMRFDSSVFDSLFASLPPWTVRVMAAGPPKFSEIQCGWGGTEAPEDDPLGPVADMYYFDKGGKDSAAADWNL